MSNKTVIERLKARAEKAEAEVTALRDQIKVLVTELDEAVSLITILDAAALARTANDRRQGQEQR